MKNKANNNMTDHALAIVYAVWYRTLGIIDYPGRHDDPDQIVFFPDFILTDMDNDRECTGGYDDDPPVTIAFLKGELVCAYENSVWEFRNASGAHVVDDWDMDGFGDCDKYKGEICVSRSSVEHLVERTQTLLMFIPDPEFWISIEHDWPTHLSTDEPWDPAYDHAEWQWVSVYEDPTVLRSTLASLIESVYCNEAILDPLDWWDDDDDNYGDGSNNVPEEYRAVALKVGHSYKNKALNCINKMMKDVLTVND